MKAETATDGREGFVLETERLVLRTCRESDKPVFAEILNTSAMMRHLGGVSPRKMIDALIDKRMADQAKHGFSYWAVELRASGELIGTCGIRLADNYPGMPIQGLHEIGWRIAERYWGCGFAREAAEASLAWAWKHTPAPLIAAWTTADNKSSLALMKRLGMVRYPHLDFIDPRADRQKPVKLVVWAIRRPTAGEPL